jgi:hypothetical protein
MKRIFIVMIFLNSLSSYASNSSLEQVLSKSLIDHTFMDLMSETEETDTKNFVLSKVRVKPVIKAGLAVPWLASAEIKFSVEMHFGKKIQ